MQGSFNRRLLLKSAGAFASIGAIRRSYGSNPPTRAAIVIGVDDCKTLPRLSAAASGASSFGRWLSDEGFQVQEFTDSGDLPVRIQTIKDATRKLLEYGSLRQLLIYFSGHGFRVGTSEFWMLTDAIADPDECVALAPTLDMAQYCGVPNVFIVSDACRSTSASLQVNQLHGGSLLRNMQARRKSAIDRFYATRTGLAAYELPVSESSNAYDGIFTKVFLEAFVNTHQSLTTTVGTTAVVENRKLAEFLEHEVEKRVESRTIQYTQRPDCDCLSVPPTYIGRVQVRHGVQAGVAPGPAQPSVKDVARAELEDIGLWRTRSPAIQYSRAQLDAVSQASNFRAQTDSIRRISTETNDAPILFETQTGFVVFGSSVSRIRATNSASYPELLERGDGEGRPAVLRLRPHSGSVLIEFPSGRSTVLAALPGFIGRVKASGGVVEDVAYLPSRNTPRWINDPEAMEDIHALHATVAAAVGQGVFRLEGNEADRNAQASEIMARVRPGKGVDPTLALYCAYAFADSGLRDHLKRLAGILRSDLGDLPFDIAMLSGQLSGKEVGLAGPCFPLCPMLTTGWSYLDVRDVKTLTDVQKASRYLYPEAIWTTFLPAGTELISKVFP